MTSKRASLGECGRGCASETRGHHRPSHRSAMPWSRASPGRSRRLRHLARAVSAFQYNSGIQSHQCGGIGLLAHRTALLKDGTLCLPLLRGTLELRVNIGMVVLTYVHDGVGELLRGRHAPRSAQHLQVGQSRQGAECRHPVGGFEGERRLSRTRRRRAGHAQEIFLSCPNTVAVQ